MKRSHNSPRPKAPPHQSVEDRLQALKEMRRELCIVTAGVKHLTGELPRLKDEFDAVHPHLVVALQMRLLTLTAQEQFRRKAD